MGRLEEIGFRRKGEDEKGEGRGELEGDLLHY